MKIDPIHASLGQPSSKKITQKKWWLLSSLLFFVAVASLHMGSYTLSIPALWQTLSGEPVSATTHLIIWDVRLARMIAAAMIGMLFALSGAILQHITRNPLADPSLIGVSQGASLAVVIAMVLLPQLSATYYPIIALIGGLVTAVIVQWIAAKKSDESSLRFILTGIGMAALISALVAAMLTYGQIQQAQAALAWLSGSIYRANWSDIRLLSLTLLTACPLLWGLRRHIAVMRLDTEIAVSLGIVVHRTLYLLITIAVCLTAAAVSVAGPLAFVGLIAPHFAARLHPTSIGSHLGLSALLGALMVCLADLLGRTLFAPFQIPAGLVTTFIGVPAFLVLMLKRLKSPSFL